MRGTNERTNKQTNKRKPLNCGKVRLLVWNVEGVVEAANPTSHRRRRRWRRVLRRRAWSLRRLRPIRHRHLARFHGRPVTRRKGVTLTGSMPFFLLHFSINSQGNLAM